MKRGISISIKADDISAHKAIQALQEYGNKRGISISFLIIQAIKDYIKELNNGKN